MSGIFILLPHVFLLRVVLVCDEPIGLFFLDDKELEKFNVGVHTPKFASSGCSTSRLAYSLFHPSFLLDFIKLL